MLTSNLIITKLENKNIVGVAKLDIYYANTPIRDILHTQQNLSQRGTLMESFFSFILGR